MSNAEYRQGYEVGQADMKQNGITVTDALAVLRAAGARVWTEQQRRKRVENGTSRVYDADVIHVELIREVEQ